MAMATFPLFPLFPTEIQLLIFEEAALEHTRDRVVVCTRGWGTLHSGELILLATRTLLTPLMRACATARRAHRNMHPVAVTVSLYRHGSLPQAAPTLDVYLSPARDVLWIASDTTDPRAGPGTIFWGLTRYHSAPVAPELRAAWRRVLASYYSLDNDHAWLIRDWWFRSGFTGVQSAGTRIEKLPMPVAFSWFPAPPGARTKALWTIVDRDPEGNALALITRPDYVHIIGPKLLNWGNHPAHRWN